jgi:hypothetical protein
VFEIHVSFFFSEGRTARAQAQDTPVALLSTAGAVPLVRAYARIRDGHARHALIEVAEHLARKRLKAVK